MAIIEAKDLVYEYIKRDEEGNVEGVVRALSGVNLAIKKGEFIAVLGGNGSGKSTFAKHINAILYPGEGTVYVDGKDTRKPENLWDIRQEAGMIFQNPDNQIIGNVVEEDVGFGPENMGIPTKEIWERVIESLKAVGMYEYRKHSPNRLSGGQKQRVAIAGVMAMHPKCIIMDEPTAMLDPMGRKEVIRQARALNDVERITIILITHYMEEVIYADRVFVMDKGQIAMQGTPAEIFSDVERLRELRLDVPQPAMLAHELNKTGFNLPYGILTREDFIHELVKYTGGRFYGGALENVEEKKSAFRHTTPGVIKRDPRESLILDHVSYVYEKGTSEEIRALDDISVQIGKGEFIGLIGHTGSGKSTFVQHLNGLVAPSEGHVYYKGEDISEKKYDRKKLRSKVGLVFQYPEHQLFEETVFKDVCFGPRNIGKTQKEAELAAYEALRAVRLPEEYYYSSPFELSGGQKRRVAIAGVLAMKPEILVLDEPTAGLDPKGRDEILDLVKDLHDKQNITIVLVSHSMEDVANYVDRILVMDKGSIIMDGDPKHIYMRSDELESMGLSAPQVTYLMRSLRERGFDLDPGITTIDDAVKEIRRLVPSDGKTGV
ncbi:MAG: energy-coupling factor transporter ATPase [Lachnospiraceae bacterium]|nr:energy-coupling factor transporter ATPase [Lachnospiraceae bacterium]